MHSSTLFGERTVRLSTRTLCSNSTASSKPATSVTASDGLIGSVILWSAWTHIVTDPIPL